MEEIRKIAKVFIASEALALFLTFVSQALTLYGLIDISVARICLVLAWVIAVLGVLASDYLRGKSWKQILVVTALVGLIVGSGLVRLDRYATHKKAEQEAISRPPSAPHTVAPPPSIPIIKTPLPHPSTRAPAPEKPQQDNSVHIGNGATVSQASAGDCSPNMIGGSNTVNCSEPAPRINISKLDVNVLNDKGRFVTRFRIDVETRRPVLLHVRAIGSLVEDIGIDDIRPPEQGGKAFWGSSISGPGWYEEDFKDIESGGYLILVRTTKAGNISLECH